MSGSNKIVPHLGESLSCLSLKQEAWSAENHLKVLPYLHL